MYIPPFWCGVIVGAAVELYSTDNSIRMVQQKRKGGGKSDAENKSNWDLYRSQRSCAAGHQCWVGPQRTDWGRPDRRNIININTLKKERQRAKQSGWEKYGRWTRCCILQMTNYCRCSGEEKLMDEQRKIDKLYELLEEKRAEKRMPKRLWR